MLMPVLSGLIVSIDAFFIGLSLGLQKKCKFLYLIIINTFLFILCILGFFIAGQIYELIPFEPDYIVGFAFIALGLWTISHYIICNYIKSSVSKEEISHKSVILVGLVMSIEAMLITMGITFIFQPYSTLFIPLTVSLAHFGYSALAFHLARTKYVQQIPAALSHVMSGLALIIYGLMALFIEFSV